MERTDDLQFKGLQLIQDTELFCFGTDAVLLADFAVVRKKARVVDLGAGSGILSVLLFGRQPEAEYHMVEIQPKLHALACRNIVLNHMEDRARAVLGDLREASRYLGRGYDVVVANPPYEKAEDGPARESACHRISRKEITMNFDALCAAAADLLRQRGRFYLIHKAERMAELLYRLKQHCLEPKVLRMVQATATASAKYVLIGAFKGAAEGIRILPLLVLYGLDGRETEELQKIYHKEQ
jgi:tRNA1Val (adenine37-N6)-methyltransferase